MTDFAVGLLQIAAQGADMAANLERGEAACRRAREMGADLALFPEMWSNGYSYSGHAWRNGNVWRAPGRWGEGEMQLRERDHEAIAELRAQATPADGPFVSHFRRLASELEMAIAITYLEATPRGARNSVSVIDRRGEIVLTYAKVHTCAFDLPEAALVAGDGFGVATLDIGRGTVEIGAMICYDREYPESARVLMVKGAEIILTPNACTLDRWRLEQFSTRAIENMVGVAMTNYPAPQNNGQSCAYHPVLFGEGSDEAQDNLIARAGAEEEIALARFDIEALRAYRRKETLGNAFRRPGAYGVLTSDAVMEPFVRVGPDGQQFDGGCLAKPAG